MKHKLQHRHNTYKDIVNVQNIGHKHNWLYNSYQNTKFVKFYNFL